MPISKEQRAEIIRRVGEDSDFRAALRTDPEATLVEALEGRASKEELVELLESLAPEIHAAGESLSDEALEAVAGGRVIPRPRIGPSLVDVTVTTSRP